VTVCSVKFPCFWFQYEHYDENCNFNIYSICFTRECGCIIKVQWILCTALCSERIIHVTITTLSMVILHLFSKTAYGLSVFMRVMWRNHAPFREDSSSVDWDLLRSTCIPNLQSFIFPHYERRYERQRKKMNLIKQLQEFLKSDHWLRRYWILSGGVFYFEPPCMYCTQAMRPSSKSSFIHSGICVRTLYQFFFNY